MIWGGLYCLHWMYLSGGGTVGQFSVLTLVVKICLSCQLGFTSGRGGSLKYS